MQLLIGTNNSGKFSQLKHGLQEVAIHCISPREAGITTDIQETGNSYQENAALKAEFYFKESGGLPTLADDSGLEVEALPNLLGIHSRRLDKQNHLTDEEWVKKFLKLMSKKTNRKAKFVSVLAYKANNQDIKYFTAEMTGVITEKLLYPYMEGIPASSLFIPDGMTQVISELEVINPNWKNHRKQAIDKFIEYYNINL